MTSGVAVCVGDLWEVPLGFENPLTDSGQVDHMHDEFLFC